MTAMTLTRTAALWAPCPAWCHITPIGRHPAHYRTVADWEGPGAVCVEVGISQTGTVPEICVEVERWGRCGETLSRRIARVAPARAYIIGTFLTGYDDRLAGALLEGARLLGVGA